MNFGKIKDTFSQHVVESHINGDDKGKKLYKKFIKAINEDEILKTQFIVYKNIEDSRDLDDVEMHDYLKENIALFDKFDKKQIVESNKKLLTILEESDKLDVPNKNFYEDLNKLIVLEKKASTINKLQESFKNVKNYIKENKEVVDLKGSEYVRENIDPKKFLSLAVEKFNSKYKEELTEEEQSIVKTLKSGSKEEKETLLETYFKETIKLINGKLKERENNITLKETLLNVKEMVYETMESKEDLKEGIIKLYELKKDLTD